jgi:hypothetical protein
MRSGRKRKNGVRTESRTEAVISHVVSAKVFPEVEAVADAVDLIALRPAEEDEAKAAAQAVDMAVAKAVKAANAVDSPVAMKRAANVVALIGVKEAKAVANAAASVAAVMTAARESFREGVVMKEAATKNHTDQTGSPKARVKTKNLSDLIDSPTKKEAIVKDHSRQENLAEAMEIHHAVNVVVVVVAIRAADVARIQKAKAAQIVLSKKISSRNAPSSNPKSKTSVAVPLNLSAKKARHRKHNKPTATDSFVSTNSFPTVVSARVAKPMN